MKISTLSGYVILLIAALCGNAAFGMQALAEKQRTVAATIAMQAAKEAPLTAEETKQEITKFTALFNIIKEGLKAIETAALDVARNAYENPDQPIDETALERVKKNVFNFDDIATRLKNIQCQALSSKSFYQPLCQAMKAKLDAGKNNEIADVVDETMINLGQQSQSALIRKSLYAAELNKRFGEALKSLDIFMGLNDIKEQIRNIQGKPSADKAVEYINNLLEALKAVKPQESVPEDLKKAITILKAKESWEKSSTFAPLITEYAEAKVNMEMYAYNAYLSKASFEEYRNAQKPVFTKLQDLESTSKKILNEYFLASNPKFIQAVEEVKDRLYADKVKEMTSDAITKMVNDGISDDVIKKIVPDVSNDVKEGLKENAIAYVNNMLKAMQKKSPEASALRDLTPIPYTKGSFARETQEKGSQVEQAVKKLKDDLDRTIPEIAKSSYELRESAWDNKPNLTDLKNKVAALYKNLMERIKASLDTIATNYDSKTLSYEEYLRKQELSNLIVTKQSEIEVGARLEQRLAEAYEDYLMSVIGRGYQDLLRNASEKNLIAALVILRDRLNGLSPLNVTNATDYPEAYQYALDWLWFMRNQMQAPEFKTSTFKVNAEFSNLEKLRLDKRKELEQAFEDRIQGRPSRFGQQGAGSAGTRQGAGAQESARKQQGPILSKVYNPRTPEIRQALFGDYTGDITTQYLIENWEEIARKRLKALLKFREDQVFYDYYDTIRKAKDDAEAAKGAGISVTPEDIIGYTAAQMYELFNLNADITDDALRASRGQIDTRVQAIRNYLAANYQQGKNYNKALYNLDYFKDFIDARMRPSDESKGDFLIRKVSELIGKYKDTISKEGILADNLPQEEKEKLVTAREQQDALKFEIDLLREYIQKTYPGRASKIATLKG